MKKYLINLLLCVSIIFSVSCSYPTEKQNATDKTSFGKKDITSDEEVSDAEETVELTGTYYGVNGSVLVLFPNGEADYYYSSSYSEPEHDNSWEYDPDEGKLNISMDTSSILFSYEVYANIAGDAKEFNLVSKSSLWDDEKYIKVSSDSLNYTKAECDKIIEANGGDQRPKPTSKPTATSTPRPTKAATATPVPQLKTPAQFESGSLELYVAVAYSDTAPGDTMGLYSLPKGYHYLILMVPFRNNGTFDAFMSSSDFTVYADNLKCEEEYILTADVPTYTSVSSGRDGTICGFFKVPKDAKKIEIEYDPGLFSDTITIEVDQVEELK